ncbi:Mitogen-activated protein kinase kinase kinase 1 [Raphanus sativus]|nr:Mitogen-activated protein kinase kinase kinase 1 [Raphanus sativus]
MKKSSGRRGDKKPVRRLKRSDVVKHNHAEAASFSSSSEDLSVSTCSLWSALMTRSLEFPDRISFRNFRVEDGETDPDDLAISFDAWEAFEKRDKFKSSDHEFHKYPVQNLNEAGPSGTADHPESTWSEASERGSFMNLLTSKGPLIDYRGSSWDFLTHEVVRRPSSSSFSDKVEEVERDVETEGRLLEPADEGGNSSSSTVSDTSPIYSSRCFITSWLNSQLVGRGYRVPSSWLKGQLLGRGSFGSVYEGITGDGDFFAVKEVSLFEQGSDQAQECIQQLEEEIALLSQLQHQNIVRYHGTDKIPDSAVSMYTRQILDGLNYLHGEGFIHRDIKCANILVDATGAVKLADFGLMAKVSKSDDIMSSKGTPFWMAPEVINPKHTDGYGNSADIWSLGCTVLEMLTRKIPYCDLEYPYQALFRIGKAELPDIPDTLSLQARDFIVQCLKAKPEERPTAAELLNHPFVRRHVSFSGSGSSSGSAQARESGSPVVTVCTANCG